MGAGDDRGRKPRLRERAYDKFTQHLIDKNILPGQFVSQRELVQLTGLTLGAIRELIPRLEADGLIVTIPQRGMQVASVDLSLIRNAFQLRLILEREAAACFTVNASDEAIGKMRADHEAIIAQARQQVTTQLRDRAQAIDWDFHDSLIDALGNEIISGIYRVNSIKIRLIRQQQTRLLKRLIVSVMGEHLAIITAFEARDAEAAAAAISHHIASARTRAMEI
jgi:DNA-binding GntR family transcriptional regulator